MCSSMRYNSATRDCPRWRGSADAGRDVGRGGFRLRRGRCGLWVRAQTSGARETCLNFDLSERFTLILARYTLDEGHYTLKATRLRGLWFG